MPDCPPRRDEPLHLCELAQLITFEPRKPVEFRDRALWLLLLDTGARCKEAVSLRVSDWRGTVIRIRNGKGGRYREMGIGTRTAQALQTYVEQHRPQPTGDDYLFLTDTGGPMNTLRVNAQLKRWAKRVGVQKATPHRFRATFATRFVRNGGERDLIRLQALLGHSTLDMSRHCVNWTMPSDTCAVFQPTGHPCCPMPKTAALRDITPMPALCSRPTRMLSICFL
jgi:integrase